MDDDVEAAVRRATEAAVCGLDEPSVHTFVDHTNGDVLVLAVANPTQPDNYGVQLASTETTRDAGVSRLVLTEREAEFLRLALNRGKKWRRSMASR